MRWPSNQCFPYCLGIQPLKPHNLQADLVWGDFKTAHFITFDPNPSKYQVSIKPEMSFIFIPIFVCNFWLPKNLQPRFVFVGGESTPGVAPLFRLAHHKLDGLHLKGAVQKQLLGGSPKSTDVQGILGGVFKASIWHPFEILYHVCSFC